jgi:hypothetical protein
MKLEEEKEMFNHKTATLISDYFYYIDIICRKDLSKNRIISERDYVSRLMTHAMYPLGPATPNGLIFWIAQTLPYNLEVKFGCDAIIIFKSGNEVKLGMFEAKWPRLNKSNDYWDKTNTHGVSRFNAELKRQNKWIKDVVIWEMFFNEKPVGSTFLRYDKYASSCVWHAYAYNHGLKIKKTWKRRDIHSVFINRDKHNSATNIKEVLYQLLICNKGKRKSIVNNKITIENRIDGNTQDIPILKGITNNSNDINSIDADNITEIVNFMKDVGLKNYIFIDLDTLKNEWREMAFFKICKLLKERVNKILYEES